MKRLNAWLLVGVLLTAAMPCLAEEAGEGNPALFASFASGVWTSIVTLIIFILLLVVLGKFAWGPLLGALKNREERIREDLETARKERQDAEKLLAQYKEQLATAQAKAEETLHQAALTAEREREKLVAQGQEQGRRAVEQAKEQIEQAKAQAVRELYAQSAKLAGELATKILHREVKPEDHRVLIQQGLEELAKKQQN